MVVCVDVRDPGNAGAVIRSADAAGADGVVCCAGTVDPFNPKTVRASAGSVLHLPVVAGGEPAEVLDALAGQGLACLAAVAHGGTPYTEVDLVARSALVFGNEASGPARRSRRPARRRGDHSHGRAGRVAQRVHGGGRPLLRGAPGPFAPALTCCEWMWPRDDAPGDADDLDLVAAATAQADAADHARRLAEVEAELLGKRSTPGRARQKALGAPRARPAAGGRASGCRSVAEQIEAIVAERRAALEETARAERLAADRLDLTEVTERRGRGGDICILCRRTRDELEDVFVGMGFAVAEGPEVETDWYNFEALNIPAGPSGPGDVGHPLPEPGRAGDGAFCGPIPRRSRSGSCRPRPLPSTR